MTGTQQTSSEINLSDPQYYFNRATSWIAFNQRVLQPAFDPSTPMLERLGAMAVFSANLDEFFMVRIAGLKQQVEANFHPGADGLTPQAQLEAVSQRLQPLVVEQHRYFEQELRPQLATQGVYILNFEELNAEQRHYLHEYFEAQIFPVLTPLAVDPGHPFPYISSLSLNLAVLIKDAATGEAHFARVKVPSLLPRFVPLPEHLQPQGEQAARWSGVPLEQVIAHNLESLFPGMNIQEYHCFRITRGADLELAKDQADDLLLAIEQELRQRRFGAVVRMEIQASVPEAIRQMLMRELALKPSDVYAVEGLLCLNDLMAVRELPLSDLQQPDWTPVVPPRLQNLEQDILGEDIFAVIRKGDLLIHHPYDSFSATIQRLINQAAGDPDVLAIKMTLYRTSGDSPIVNMLITAAENGKQVAVLVELKARFDEQNNILWARRLEKAGVHVAYGFAGLKTHAKTTMVVRREAGRICRYVHIGSGDYNPRTARFYTDLGLLSCTKELGDDLTDLFNYLTGYSRQRVYRRFLVAPFNLRDRMLALIHREIDHQRRGKPSHIVAKMNAMTDPDIIAALYEASQAGVQIELIVREMCCLRPGVPGVSDNIRVVSILGRFLEHSRIYAFHNQGQPEYFIGSADWRSRNLDRRVEVVIPAADPAIAQQLQEILDIMLADNCSAWELQPDGNYVQLHPAAGEPKHCSQEILMERTLQAAEH